MNTPYNTGGFKTKDIKMLYYAYLVKNGDNYRTVEVMVESSLNEYREYLRQQIKSGVNIVASKRIRSDDNGKVSVIFTERLGEFKSVDEAVLEFHKSNV